MLGKSGNPILVSVNILSGCAQTYVRLADLLLLEHGEVGHFPLICQGFKQEGCLVLIGACVDMPPMFHCPGNLPGRIEIECAGRIDRSRFSADHRDIVDAGNGSTGCLIDEALLYVEIESVEQLTRHSACQGIISSGFGWLSECQVDIFMQRFEYILFLG